MTNDRFRFRAWLKNDKVMVDKVMQITDNPNTQYIKFDKIKNWKGNYLNNPTFASLNDVELMQCLGLKDKNGKLIYESDIVKYIDYAGRNQIGVINWWEFCYFANALGGDDEGNQDIELHPDYLKDIEVVGNIYENEKLLNND